MKMHISVEKAVGGTEFYPEKKAEKGVLKNSS